MRTYDFSPLFRSVVGFDRMNRMLETAMQGEEAPSYPPYNIEKLDENSYLITMAVAGFHPEELDVTVKESTLFISGKAVPEEGDKARTFLHRGIARRAFERQFQLAEHIRVGEADLSNGLLSISLVREVPESAKPRTIAIKAGEGTKTITN